MDQNTINQLLRMIGDAFYAYEKGLPPRNYIIAIEDWMKKYAPEHLKNIE